MNLIEENINNRNIVKTSHELNHFRGGYTRLELDFIYSFISTIRREDSEFHEYTLTLKDLEKKLDKRLQLSKIEYLFDTLASKTFKVKNDEKLAVFPFFQKFEYNKSEKTVSVKFNEELKPHLIQLNTYAMGNLKDILLYRSEYSKRIYMLLSQWRKKGTVTYTISELREILAIPTKYKYGNFKQKVLTVAYEELMKKGDISFEYTEIKETRKVTKIKFDIFSNNLELNLLKYEISNMYPDQDLFAINTQILRCSSEKKLYWNTEFDRVYLINDYANKCWEILLEKKEKLAIYTPHLFQDVKSFIET